MTKIMTTRSRTRRTEISHPRITHPAFILPLLIAAGALASYGFLPTIAAYAQAGDQQWNDQHFPDHTYNSDTQSYSDSSGNEYNCQYSHDGELYYYYNNNYYNCDDYSSSGTENSAQPYPYYYDQHFSDHTYNSDTQSYSDSSGNSYPCESSDDGNYYYSYNDNFYKCDDFSSSSSGGSDNSGGSTESEQDTS